SLAWGASTWSISACSNPCSGRCPGSRTRVDRSSAELADALDAVEVLGSAARCRNERSSQRPWRPGADFEKASAPIGSHQPVAHRIADEAAGGSRGDRQGEENPWPTAFRRMRATTSWLVM